jgi:hypothetical protein
MTEMVLVQQPASASSVSASRASPFRHGSHILRGERRNLGTHEKASLAWALGRRGVSSRYWYADIIQNLAEKDTLIDWVALEPAVISVNTVSKSSGTIFLSGEA